LTSRTKTRKPNHGRGPECSTRVARLSAGSHHSSCQYGSASSSAPLGSIRAEVCHIRGRTSRSIPLAAAQNSRGRYRSFDACFLGRRSARVTHERRASASTLARNQFAPSTGAQSLRWRILAACREFVASTPIRNRGVGAPSATPGPEFCHLCHFFCRADLGKCLRRDSDGGIYNANARPNWLSDPASQPSTVQDCPEARGGNAVDVVGVRRHVFPGWAEHEPDARIQAGAGRETLRSKSAGRVTPAVLRSSRNSSARCSV